MSGNIFRIVGMAALGMMAGAHATWAQHTPTTVEDAPGNGVSVEAQLLDDADDIALSAQQLQPIALENLPTRIDPTTLRAGDAPRMGVSSTARTLRDLDPAGIQGTAHTLGGIARDQLPGAAGAAGAYSPPLPSAAQNRSRGRGGH